MTTRRYAVLYNSTLSMWSVIFQDDGETTWYTYLHEVEDAEQANQIVNALNSGKSTYEP